jgi:hypothetical protein
MKTNDAHKKNRQLIFYRCMYISNIHFRTDDVWLTGSMFASPVVHTRRSIALDDQLRRKYFGTSQFFSRDLVVQHGRQHLCWKEPCTLTQGEPVFPGSSLLGIEPKTPRWLVQDSTIRPIEDLILTIGRSGDHQGASVFPGSSRLGIEPKTPGWLVQIHGKCVYYCRTYYNDGTPIEINASLHLTPYPNCAPGT